MSLSHLQPLVDNNVCGEDEEVPNPPLSKHSSSPLISSSSSDEVNDDDLEVVNHVVNKRKNLLKF